MRCDADDGPVVHSEDAIGRVVLGGMMDLDDLADVTLPERPAAKPNLHYSLCM